MSSDKISVPKCISNSDSFDHRICEDLSEQFSVTIYSSLQSDHEMSKQIEDNVFEIHYLKSIETLLKKCPNIQSIHLFVKNNEIFKSILPLIFENCRNLNEFKVSLKDRRTEPRYEGVTNKLIE